MPGFLALQVGPLVLMATLAVCGAGLYWIGTRGGRRAGERKLARIEGALESLSQDSPLGLAPELKGLSATSADALEHMHQVIERFGDGAQEAERQREDALIVATRASRARGEFLAAMSHELRTPLNGSLGMIALLLDTELSREQREFAMTAKRSCQSLLGVIDEVLDFTTLEGEGMTLEHDDFRITASIWDTLDEFSPRAAQRGLSLCYHEVDPLPAVVTGDRARFRQILGNLLDNAIKFTHEGEVSLRSSIVTNDSGNLRVAFELSDTGVGIPADKRAEAFEPFSQADQTKARRYEGAGLGLVIVQRLLAQMNGLIDFVSEPEHGTTFRFEIVFAIPEQDQVQRPDKTVVTPGSRALLCTSHSSFAEAFGAQLTQLGFEVEAVSDPELALDMRRANPPLVFWIDDTLPNLELHQLRRALIEEQLPGDTKYVLLHGPSDRQPHEGFHAHINRPPRPALLRALTLQICEDSVKAALPACVEEETPTPPPTKPDRVRYEGRVLVVEDNAVNRRIVTALLEKRGIEVETANNGHESLTMLRIVNCDLILMDVQMPEMDGIEATRRIRAGEAGACLDVPIVALTAGDQPSDRAACREAGMEDYIRKPLTEKDLDQVLGKWLREVTLLED